MAAGAFGHIDALPDDIRDVFMWLCQDVVSLRLKWDMYLELFGNPAKSAIIDQLPRPFSVIEEALRTAMTMAVCRLSDPHKSCGKENLNFRALEVFYGQDEDFKLLIADFVASCEPVKKHRDKLVAHSDKVARLTPQQAMIPQIKRTDIDEILKKAETILNHVARNYGNFGYVFGLPGDSGAVSLLYWIEKGLGTRRTAAVRAGLSAGSIESSSD